MDQKWVKTQHLHPSPFLLMFRLPLQKWSPRPPVNVWLLALSSWSEEKHMWKEVIFFFFFWPKRWCILNVCGIRTHIHTMLALPPRGLIYFFSCIYEMRSNKRIRSQDTNTNRPSIWFFFFLKFSKFRPHFQIQHLCICQGYKGIIDFCGSVARKESQCYPGRMMVPNERAFGQVRVVF